MLLMMTVVYVFVVWKNCIRFKFLLCAFPDCKRSWLVWSTVERRHQPRRRRTPRSFLRWRCHQNTTPVCSSHCFSGIIFRSDKSFIAVCRGFTLRCCCICEVVFFTVAKVLSPSLVAYHCITALVPILGWVALVPMVWLSLGWLSGRTSVSDQRTFTGLHRTCSWWVNRPL